MKRRPKNPAAEELKLMLPFFLAVNALIFIGCGIYGLFEPLSWRAPLGILLGDALCAANFWLTGVTANKTLMAKNPKRGKNFAAASYGMRYIGLFLCYAAALMLGIIDIIPAFLPLFIPKLYYTFYYIFFANKGKDREKPKDGGLSKNL